MDNNTWFYSSLAQSVAAIIGILSAFNINMIINLLAEYKAINEKKKEIEKETKNYLNDFLNFIEQIREAIKKERYKHLSIFKQKEQNAKIERETMISANELLKYDSDEDFDKMVEEKVQPPHSVDKAMTKINQFKEIMRQFRTKEGDINESIININDKIEPIYRISIMNIALFAIGVVIPLNMLPSNKVIFWIFPVKALLLLFIGACYGWFTFYTIKLVYKISSLKDTLAQKYSEDENIKKLIWEGK